MVRVVEGKVQEEGLLAVGGLPDELDGPPRVLVGQEREPGGLLDHPRPVEHRTGHVVS